MFTVKLNKQWYRVGYNSGLGCWEAEGISSNRAATIGKRRLRSDLTTDQKAAITAHNGDALIEEAQDIVSS